MGAAGEEPAAAGAAGSFPGGLLLFFISIDFLSMEVYT